MEEQPAETAIQRAWDCIAHGRGALAMGDASAMISPVQEKGAIAQLLLLLWHRQPEIRRGAALALVGGDRHASYIPQYGYFVGAFLRGLRGRPGYPPPTPAERYEAVAHSLQRLLDQNAGEIHAMGSMRYSFLSSSLYLALLSTCRDTMEAIRRLRVVAAHSELCSVLANLTHRTVERRVNRQDNDLLAQTAGRALAALSPEEIPAFWQGLTHHLATRQRAVAPALSYISDRRAVPYLLEALEQHPSYIVEQIIDCLGNLGDSRALPTLTAFLQNRDRLVRQQCRLAIAAIERANCDSPARTLLRPVHERAHESTAELLRSLPTAHRDAPEELLHVREI